MDGVIRVLRVLRTPVTLIVLLVIVAGAGYWGLKAASTPFQKAATACVMTDVGAELTPDKVTVKVYNGSTVPRLAKDARSFLLAWHFRVADYNNTERQVTGIVVIGNSVDSPEVKLVQQFFPGSTAEGDGRADHVVEVILGTRFERLQAPVASVPVKGPVCLPPLTKQAIETPSPSATATPK